MCGIAGYLDFERNVNIQVLNNMAKVIRHRGPDDEGYALFDSLKCYHFSGEDTVDGCSVTTKLINALDQVRDCFLGFGYRRLSIIDVSPAGHQPMVDKENQNVIVFNGEIYNYIEIRDELQKSGFQFRTNTDTEVLLAAYRMWGEECVNHFNGMWAFAIFDRENSKLFCSRDRLGAKPFYYHFDGNHFVFGSEIKEICQDDILEKKFNEKRLAATLLMRIQDYSEETLIKGIFELQGGTNLTLELDLAKRKILKFKKKIYWDLNVSNEGKSSTWYDKICESIRLRLRSDVPIGVMVSGGVDSSFLLNEICKYKNMQDALYSSSLDTFTSCYRNDSDNDETYYAHLVNKAWNTKEHLLYPDDEDTLTAYKKMIWHYEDLAPFSTLGSFMTLREVAKTGVKVIINGQGGDESMLGYERYYAYYLLDLIKKNPLFGLKQISSIVHHSKLSYKELAGYIIYFGMPRIRIFYNKVRAKHLFKKAFLKNFSVKEMIPLLKVRNLNEMIYKEIRKTQLPHILRMEDRGYMAHSMESRVPFIDYRYLEEAIQIPPMSKIQNGYTKYLLREKMQNTIPDEVVWRKSKNGWSSPGKRWVDRFEQSEVEKMLRAPVSEKYFNMPHVRQQWIDNPSGKEMETFFFVEVFMREFHISV
ncbi:MAG: asparagine synthase (glutamine-hydrolyzing) [[Clostridium] symbiosum]